MTISNYDWMSPYDSDLQLYTSYVNNYSTANNLVAQLRQTSVAFDQFVTNRMTDASLNLPLEALLITPIQRLPRYELLMRVCYEEMTLSP